MSDKNAFQAWLKERNVEDVEALVPDMAGAARGKLLPADKLVEKAWKCLDLTQAAI